MTIEEVLELVGGKIVNTAKTNLQKAKKIATGNLYNSVSYNLEDGNLGFDMEPYGEFVDQGVNGTGKNWNAPFTYKNFKSSNGQFIKSLKEWCKIRGMEEGAAYAVRKHIFKNGLKPTHFFSDPYEQYIEEVDALIDEAIDDTLDKII